MSPRRTVHEAVDDVVVAAVLNLRGSDRLHANTGPLYQLRQLFFEFAQNQAQNITLMLNHLVAAPSNSRRVEAP